MAFTLVTDELWNKIEPLFPRPKPKLKGSHPPISHRACLTGVVYVLRSGMAWNMIPAELGCGVTCWRRLRDWTMAGVWSRAHQLLLDTPGRGRPDRLLQSGDR